MLPLLAAGGRMGVLAGSTVRFGFITFIFHDYSPLFMMALSRQRPDIFPSADISSWRQGNGCVLTQGGSGEESFP